MTYDEQSMIPLLSLSNQQTRSIILSFLAMIGFSSMLYGCHPTCSHLKLNFFFLNTVNPIKMTVQTVLAGVLFTTLRAYDVCILIPEVHVLYVSLQRHLVKVLMTIRTLFPTVPLLLPRSVWRTVTGYLGVRHILHRC